MAFDVFLSHFSEEQSLAEFVQTWLRSVFGGKVGVFRSSDHQSIGTGTDPYDSITSALGEAKVFVALVSKYGAKRPWVNFEAGFAAARGIPSFFLRVRNTSASDIPPPIGRLQLRPLANRSVINEIVEAISSATGVKAGSCSPDQFVGEVVKRETAMPDRELRLVPLRTVSGKGSARSEKLQFDIVYDGTRPTKLVKIWVEIPRGLMIDRLPSSLIRDVPNHRHFEMRAPGNESSCRIELTANLNPPDALSPAPGFEPLNPHLSPSKRPQLLRQMRIDLRQDPTPEALAEPIRWQIVTKEGEIPVASCRLEDIEVRQSA